MSNVLFNPTFKTKADAKRVLGYMKEIIERYGEVTLGDAKDLIGEPSTHKDQKQGWSSLGEVDIHQNTDGYLLDLPLMENLNDNQTAHQ